MSIIMFAIKNPPTHTHTEVRPYTSRHMKSPLLFQPAMNHLDVVLTIHVIISASALSHLANAQTRAHMHTHTHRERERERGVVRK